MIKRIITDISEEDFRKLDITVYKHEMITEPDGKKRLHYVPYKLNDLLDKDIAYTMEQGYESDLKDLQTPVTIAIHEDNFGDVDPSERAGLHGYFDKFMNMYSGITTYYIAWGIKHLYSTRDYFEDHEDYWRVRKDETKVIYRVKLADHWLKEFVLKHKAVHRSWPYPKLPTGVNPDFNDAEIVICYDLIDGEWRETNRYGRFIYDHSEHHIPVDANGHAIPRAEQ